jgi:PAS domain S-box-containing protein
MPHPFVPDAALLDAALNGLSDGFWVLDRVWKFVYVNAEACRSTSETAENVLGRSLWEVFPALLGSPAESEFKRAAAARVSVEFDHFYKPLQRWFGIKLFPLPNGGLAILTRDVTAAKEAEGALRAAHDTFRHLVEHSPFGVYAVDADFRIVQASAGARTVFANVQPLLGRDFAEVLRIVWPEPFAGEAIAHFRHTLETGVPYHAPSTVAQRADTKELEAYDWKVERLLLPDGRFGVVCHFYDLTERVRFQAALRASEERFRLASDAAGAMVYDVDLTGMRKIITHGLERVTGYRPDDVDLTADWWLSIIHPEDLAAHRAKVEQHLALGGRYEATYRIRRRDGEWIQAEVTAQTFRNEAGDPVQIVGTLVDVTQRRRAEEALRASEQNFRRLHGVSSRLLSADNLERSLRDVLDNAIVSCGAFAGTIQLLDPSTNAMKIAVQQGLTQEFLDHFREVHLMEGAACLRAPSSGDRMVIEDVERGESFTLHRGVAASAGVRAVQSTPLRTHDGIVVGMLSTYFRAPHLLVEGDHWQLDLYARHAVDLIMRLRYEQALQDAERCKDEFLATLAHELRNLLAPLKSCVEIMKRSGHDAEPMKRALATMERQIRQMARLVDDLLDVSRIASNKLELMRDRTELSTILRDVAEACRPLAERAGLQLGVNLPATPIYLYGDTVRLTQVFTNLVMNSCKYTESGGRITITVDRRGREAFVSVRDSGAGIPPDLLPKVFDLFMQVERTLDRSKGGLGLGLPLVKRLVELHEGRVTAHSDGLGRGSEFVVRLPTLEEETDARLRADALRGLI